MITPKDFLSALIGVTSARPTGEYTTITPIVGINSSYTMPYDGWVQLYGSGGSSGENAYFQLWSSDVERLTTTTTLTTPGGWSTKVIGFFKKGDLFFYNIDGYNEMKINIFRVVGGGLSSILQAIGGGLCLLSLSFNRFTSSLALKQCLVRKSLKSRISARTLCNIPLRQTAMRAFSTTAGLRVSSAISKFQGSCAQLRAITTAGRACFVRAKKATQFITDQRVTLQPHDFFVSSQQLAQANLVMGGAL